MKITALTFLIMIACSSFLYAQKKITSIGVELNPGIATITNPIVKDNYERFSTNGGILIRRDIVLNYFSMETGICFYDRGYQFNVPIRTSGSAPIENWKFQEKEGYLSIPLSFIGRCFGFYLGLGINAEYYLFRRVIFNNSLVSKDKFHSRDLYAYGSQLFLGHDFSLSSKLKLNTDIFLAPLYNQKDRIYNQLFNYGFGIGLKYVLNKKQAAVKEDDKSEMKLKRPILNNESH